MLKLVIYKNCNKLNQLIQSDILQTQASFFPNV